jgi:prepilin-type N-terminal cleavage/methylation domain-containing protein/prepilin-type processing-associated H-X9-DG protein
MFVQTRRAFTLVELLVVIAVITVLIALLLPVLGSARRQARTVAELAASRQLMVAYLAYTQDNKGALIPGHVPDAVRLDDERGDPLTPTEVGRRWPWRLVANIRYGLRGTLLVNERAQALSNRNATMWTYSISLTPSFGLNFFSLGGDTTSNGALNLPGCLTRITQTNQSSRLIVFVSARSNFGAGVVEGYWKVVPPTKPFEFSASGWTRNPYDESVEPAAWGYVHPRHNGRAVIACLDGHAELLAMDDLRDMTRWSERAARAGNPNWKP